MYTHACRATASLMITLSVWAVSLSVPVGAVEEGESVEKVDVTGGARPSEVDFNLSKQTRRPGVGAGSGATSRPRTASPLVKPPVPKPYALSELTLRSDPRGREGLDLNGEQGTWCVVTRVRTSATPFPAGRINKTSQSNRTTRDLGYPPCAALASESAKALSLKLTLPTPTLEIDPGWAITGPDAFLETKGTTVYDSGPIATEWGTMTMTGTGSYFVDWGDNTAQMGPYDFEGVSWPEGQIRHVYQYTGTYTVTVRQRWNLHWQVAQRSGVISDRFTETTLVLPVRELQAIRIR